MSRSPTGTAQSNPAAAEKWYTAGRSYFGSGNYADALRAFDTAVRANDRDARYVYFRGLSRFGLGLTADAANDFAAAATLERQNLPYPSDVDLALERVQGDARRALNRYRP